MAKKKRKRKKKKNHWNNSHKFYCVVYKGASEGGWLATHFTPLEQPLHPA